MGCLPSHYLRDMKQDSNKLTRTCYKYHTSLYVTCLRDALNRGDAHYMLSILMDCDVEQKADIFKVYGDRCGGSLLDHINASNLVYGWSSWIILTLQLIILQKHHSSIVYIKKLLRTQPFRERTLAQVLCSQDARDIQLIVEGYRNITGSCLFDELTCRCVAVTAEALGSILARKNFHVNVLDGVKELELSSTDNLFRDGRLFFVYLRFVPNDKLRDIFGIISMLSSNDISAQIKSYYPPGGVQETLKTIVNVMSNRALQRVTRIRELVFNCSADGEKEELCYLLLAPTLENITEMKRLYRSTYHLTLAKDIQDQIEDESLIKILLHAINY